MTRRNLVVTGLAAGALAASPPQPSFAAPENVTAFINGRIYTVEDAQPWAQAVVVRGRRIRNVGDDAGAMKLAGRGAEIFDLEGRMMLPGFVESHWHLATVAFAQGAWVNYDRVEDIYEALRQYAESHPNEKFISGFGWIAANFPAAGPRKEPLDEIVPDRPVLLISNDFHSYWVNSKFLEMAGIDKHTPRDVVPGSSWCEKDPETGRADGLHERTAGLVRHAGGLRKARDSALWAKFRRRRDGGMAAQARRNGNNHILRRGFRPLAGPAAHRLRHPHGSRASRKAAAARGGLVLLQRRENGPATDHPGV